ncbi:MAG: hypothetical protein H7231_09865 [Rhodoferax sp.]|nr:hypothetical protein [Actinomycetota bacterium]
MSILDLLAEAGGVYWGRGTGPDEFVARVSLTDAGDGTLVMEYEAWSHENGLQHAEAARLGRVDDGVTLVATSDGASDTMVFREGEHGVFGSTGPERVGLVITADDDDLTFSWWWPDEGGHLREQSRAVMSPVRPTVTAPPLPGQVPDVRADSPADLAAAPGASSVAVPWPGIVVLAGPGTGVVAQRLAERLSRAAVVRTDLFDKAVRGNQAGAPDPVLRHAISVAVVRGYAVAGHPVIVHGAADRSDHERLVAELEDAGLAPVRLVDVEDGEDYGEVARRLIER